MKFKKFVKSLGADGVLYNRSNGERWLTSGSIFMKVPEDIRTVTACDSAEMPSLIEDIINYDTFSQPCALVEAVMPAPDGVIKDCVRIFATENGIDKTAIANDGYALIERGDIVEMYVTEKISALVIKRPVDLVDEEIVGVILRTDY
jgi:hypothetical protein